MRASNSFNEQEVSCLDLILSYMLRGQNPPQHLRRQPAFQSLYAKAADMKKKFPKLQQRDV